MVNFVRYKKLFKLYELMQPHLKYSLPVEKGLPHKDVLVIAPHPDDEVIGCGGTLLKHVKDGGTLEILYCTLDTDERFNEARAAAKMLGATQSHFLKYPVESLPHQQFLADKILAVITKINPEIIMLPFWFDNHVDHRAVNKALVAVSKRIDISCMVYAYPVWFPVYPNVLIDISDVWEEKKKAIEIYKSQLATRDYVTMSGSLSQYWAQVKGRGIKHAESYFRATFPEYIKLCRKFKV